MSKNDLRICFVDSQKLRVLLKIYNVFINYKYNNEILWTYLNTGNYGFSCSKSIWKTLVCSLTHKCPLKLVQFSWYKIPLKDRKIENYIRQSFKAIMGKNRVQKKQKEKEETTKGTQDGTRQSVIFISI